MWLVLDWGCSVSISWKAFNIYTHPELVISYISCPEDMALETDETFEISLEQWDELQQHLSNDLDENRKSSILKLMRAMVYFLKSPLAITSNYSCPPAKIKKELIAFKETAIKLMKRSGYLDPTKVESTPEAKMAINNAYSGLSIGALVILNTTIFMMTRQAVTTYGGMNCPLEETLHPSQYYCASIISLDILSRRKNPQNPKGAGRANDDKRGLYHSIFELWRDLGETNTKTYNGDYYTDHLVSFAHTLLNYVGDNRTVDTVRKDLAKYKKIYMRNP